MSGVESSTSAGMVRAIWGCYGSRPTFGVEQEYYDPLHRGALDLARTAVRQVLGNTGFVDVTGPATTNFKVYLTRSPVELSMEDLKPGLLNDIASWVASVLAGAPEQGLQVQAHVSPDAAMKLLI